MIRENALCGLMKEAYKGDGYWVYAQGGEIMVWASAWAVRYVQDAFPRKALGLMAEHMGLLPDENAAYLVKKDKTQTMMPDKAEEYWAALRPDGREARPIMRTQLTYCGRALWQMPESGRILAFQPALAGLFIAEKEDRVSSDGTLLYAEQESGLVVIAPFKLPADIREALERNTWYEDGGVKNMEGSGGA